MKNEPRPSDAPSVPSTERVTAGRRLPDEWLDRLLAAACAVRANAPFEDSATLILGVAHLVDDVAFGVCVPRAALGRPGALPAGAEGGQIVLRVAPTRASHPTGTDPARLFPELAFERVLPITVGPQAAPHPGPPAQAPIAGDSGATLHLASDDDLHLVDGAPASLVAERLVMMLGTLIENHRALERGVFDLKAQVIQTEKLASLGQIAAGIVHELNNPLTTIVAYSDFLRKKLERKGGEPADVERLVRINEAAERILRFSRDLTAYSRPANEVPAPVAIHDVIERALVFCEHELEKTGVIVERSFGEVRPVRGVAGQLTQVFVNLFTNAAHAMRQHGGLLTIATTTTDDEVEVTVSDDGHGIDADNLPRIFDPFFTTKTDGSGTGLGLSIVRSIVTSHGGRISVNGNDPQGTVFLLGLPTAAAPKSDH